MSAKKFQDGSIQLLAMRYAQELKGGGMKMETNDTLEKYIKLYEEINEKVQDEQLAKTIFQEVVKDRRMVGKLSRNKRVKNNGPATEKQIAYLEILGVDIEPGLTKQRASELIDEATEEGA